eukprot:1845371-Pleurochrysis_carterae.AAC.5
MAAAPPRVADAAAENPVSLKGDHTIPPSPSLDSRSPISTLLLAMSTYLSPELCVLPHIPFTTIIA